MLLNNLLLSERW